MSHKLELDALSKFMFDNKNLRNFTKHNIDFVSLNDTKSTNQPSKNLKTIVTKETIKVKDTIYKPYKKDSLFWCFFILKHGFSKYEMEIGNQHFLIEKKEKFEYIDLLRMPNNKDMIKMHKIKPLSLLEDDLANQERISIKTFFAMCIIEKMNILLIDKRKIYEIITTDDAKIYVIHRNSVTYEHHIELDVSVEKINTYRETYYKMQHFDSNLKSMTSYKVEELLELCKKLDIVLPDTNNTNDKKTQKKLSKKDIYELLVQQF